jgi:hypothetical protein
MLRTSVVLAAAILLAAADVHAIEMFTFFGDGSQIGLPRLEVPVEAYPGIPLRSDRIRARRRAARPAAAARGGRTATVGSVTLREVPTGPTAATAPAGDIPVAPEPE